MESFFRPSLDAISSRAIKMLERAGGADVIVLVGGFSASSYVRTHLQKILGANGTPVVAPNYGATAVLEGGVWFARYPGAIAARRSNMSYGIRTAVLWREGAPDRTWIAHKHACRCRHCFTRYVKMDELVRSGAVMTKSFHPLQPYQTFVDFDIYGCTSNTARYTTAAGMRKIATARVDFPACKGDLWDYWLTAEFSFGDTEISVRCTDVQTGNETRTTLMFDSADAMGGCSWEDE